MKQKKRSIIEKIAESIKIIPDLKKDREPSLERMSTTD